MAKKPAKTSSVKMVIHIDGGRVERKGRDLRITLPEHWNDETAK